MQVNKYIQFVCEGLVFSGIERMREEAGQLAIKVKEEENEYRIKQGTYDLLPQADANIAKLKVKLT